MGLNNNGRASRSIYHVALVGMMAATLEVAKLVLAFLPNIEVVTLLCGLYGYVFGPWGILATVVFVAIEPLIWGFGTWIIYYLIYWPLVATVFFLLGKPKIRNRVLLTAVALMLTLGYGVLSSLVDVGLFSGSYDRFWYRFSIYYARGIWFYVAMLVSNAIAFPLLFRPLANLLTRWKK